MQKPMQLLFSILLIISLLMNGPLVFAHTEATNTRYTTEAIRSNTIIKVIS